MGRCGGARQLGSPSHCSRDHFAAVTLALSLHSAAAHVQSAFTLDVAASTRALALALSTPAGDDRVGATLEASRRALEVSLDHLRSATSHAAAVIAQPRGGA